MSDIKAFFQSIHERSLWQVLGTYLAASWLALQVVETLSGTVGLPDWVGPSVFVLLAIGLPILLVTSFVQGGIQRRKKDAPAKGLFTWRRALLGGAAAFAGLGVITAVYLLMRGLGIGPVGTLVSQGVLDESAIVVLADFAPAANPDARAATEAFRVDFSQSRVIRLADDLAVGAALARMERDPIEPLDRETALELAVREGYTAVIAGEINRAGVGYVLSAELVPQSGGDVLVSRRVTARDSTEVLDAIDELSKQLRERIGESLARFEHEPALTQVTTSSLEALRKYSQARFMTSTGTNLIRARALLEEATDLDSTFALAWEARAIEASNRGEDRALQVDAFGRAFRHRDRLTERERYSVEHTYYNSVRGDPGRAVTALENLLEIDPDDVRGTVNLSALYLDLRRYEEAEDLALRGLALDSTLGVAAWNAAEAQGRLGKFETAEATIRSYGRTAPAFPFDEVAIAYFRASQGDYSYADSVFVDQREVYRGDPFWRALTSIDLGSVAAVRGQVDLALAHLEDAAAANEERGLVRESLRVITWAALLESRVLENREAALVRLEASLNDTPLSGLTPLDRPYSALAEAFASAGDVDTATRLMQERDSELPEDVVEGNEYPQFKLAVEHPDRALGEIALAAGRYDEAIEAFRRSDAWSCQLCALPGLARAYDAAGQADSAVAVYERYLETPESFRLASGDAIHRGIILERLAQLHDETGDSANSAQYYRELTILWSEADESLLPRVLAAQARLNETAR